MEFGAYRSPPARVRNAVFRTQSETARPHYFGTYLDNASIVKLHFEHFSCEGMQTYRRVDRCLHEEFARSGSHYQLTRNYYGRCDD